MAEKTYITVHTLFQGAGIGRKRLAAGTRATAKQLGLDDKACAELIARGALAEAEADQPAKQEGGK